MAFGGELIEASRIEAYCDKGNTDVNTCQVLVESSFVEESVESCSDFCESYHGMTCASASSVYTVRTHYTLMRTIYTI